jgi:hypothetical protein
MEKHRIAILFSTEFASKDSENVDTESSMVHYSDAESDSEFRKFAHDLVDEWIDAIESNPEKQEPYLSKLEFTVTENQKGCPEPVYTLWRNGKCLPINAYTYTHAILHITHEMEKGGSGHYEIREKQPEWEKPRTVFSVHVA